MDKDLKIGSEYVDLHQRVMKHITEDQTHWKQTMFASLLPLPENILWGDGNAQEKWYRQERTCETTCCYAGWAVLLAGYRLNNAGAAMMPDGTTEEVEHLAEKLLGLSRGQADQIFYFFGESGDDEQPAIEEMKERVSQVTGITFD